MLKVESKSYKKFLKRKKNKFDQELHKKTEKLTNPK